MMKLKQLLRSFLTISCLVIAANSSAQLAGSGTAVDPYLVQSAADLVSLSDTGIGANWNHFLLTTDIDMTGQTFYGIAAANSTNGEGNFNGTFDGGGHEIRNLTITAPGGDIYDVGFVARLMNGSKVVNLGIRNLTIDAPTYEIVGGIAGRMTNVENGAIENCYVVGGSIIGVKHIGGIVGQAYQGTVRNCYTDVRIEANGGAWSPIGGIAGHANTWAADETTIENVVVYDSVIGTGNLDPVNAIIGDDHGGGTVSGLYFSDSVGRPDANGTLVADADLYLESSYPELDFDNFWKILDGKAVLQTTPGAKPTAVASDDQDVIEGVSVTLDGLASKTSTTSYALDYIWETGEGYPALTFNNSAANDSTTFDVPTGFSSDTALMVLLRVFDENEDTSAYDTVMINIRTVAENNVPNVNAGDDITVQYNSPVTLTGVVSDADGDEFTIEWTAPEQVTPDTLLLNNISFVAPNVLADSVLVFTLTATDSPVGGVGSDEVEVTVIANVAPTATATASTDRAMPTDEVTVTATNATDANGDVISYAWSASATGISFIDATAANTSFLTPATATTESVVITLEVSDGILSSTSTVTVTIGPNSINEFAGLDVWVYPNPSNGLFNVEVPVNADLKVINILGAVIHSQSVSAGLNTIDLSGFTEGIYFVNIVDKNNIRTLKLELK